jgi:hypothetical protein
VIPRTLYVTFRFYTAECGMGTCVELSTETQGYESAIRLHGGAKRTVVVKTNARRHET